jgi:hypothetical protein
MRPLTRRLVDCRASTQANIKGERYLTDYYAITLLINHILDEPKLETTADFRVQVEYIEEQILQIESNV